MQAEAYDLVIFDQCAPERPEDMPAANTLFIGRLPPLDSWRAEASPPPTDPSSPPPADPASPLPVDPSPPTPVAAPQIIDWQRSHPLLNLVELGNVAVIDSLIVTPPPGGKVLVGGAYVDAKDKVAEQKEQRATRKAEKRAAKDAE